MSYNNQPDWETYKPTIVHSTKKSESKKKIKMVIKKKFKIVVKKKPKLVIKKKPSILIQEEQLLDQLVIPIKYAMSLFGPDEDEELEQCVGLDDYRCAGKKLYKKEELDLGMCKECYKKMDEESSAIEKIDNLMDKLVGNFTKKINSVNMSKDEKELLHYFSGKKNAKRR